MRPWKFNMPMVESSTPPQRTNVLWVDIDESTNKLTSIKKFNKQKWEELLDSTVGTIITTTQNYKSMQQVSALTQTLEGEYDENGNYVSDGPTVSIPIFGIDISDITSSPSRTWGSYFWDTKNAQIYKIYVDITNVFNEIIELLVAAGKNEIAEALKVDYLKIGVDVEFLECYSFDTTMSNAWDIFSIPGPGDKPINVESAENFLDVAVSLIKMLPLLNIPIPGKPKIGIMRLKAIDVETRVPEVVDAVMRYGSKLLQSIPLICVGEKALLIMVPNML